MLLTGNEGLLWDVNSSQRGRDRDSNSNQLDNSVALTKHRGRHKCHWDSKAEAKTKKRKEEKNCDKEGRSEGGGSLDGVLFFFSPHIPGMKVKPPGSCMTPVEAPAVLRTVPLALTLLPAETGAR